jgi:hypothetical protein
MIAPEDQDAIIRAVAGEASGEPPEGQQAVAHVILNRASQSGESPTDVVSDKHQFESWSTPRVQQMDPNSKTYQQVYNNIAPVLSGQAPDPTGGADHFLNPQLQAADGRQQPAWAKPGQGQPIGNHVFYRQGYAAPKDALSDKDISNILGTGAAGAPMSATPQVSGSPSPPKPQAGDVLSDDEVAQLAGVKSPPAGTTAPQKPTAGQQAAQAAVAKDAKPAGFADAYLNSFALGQLPAVDAGLSAIGTGVGNVAAKLGIGQGSAASPIDTFNAVQKSEQGALDTYAQQHPIANAAAEIGGMITPVGAAAGLEHLATGAIQHAAPKLAATTAGRVATRIGANAATAGAYSASDAASHGDNAGQIATAAGEGTLAGAALGGVGEAAGAIAPAATRGISNPAIRAAAPAVAGAGIGAGLSALTGGNVAQGAMTGGALGLGAGKAFGPRERVVPNEADMSEAVQLAAKQSGQSIPDLAASLDTAHPASTTAEELPNGAGTALLNRAASTVPEAAEPTQQVVAQRATAVPQRLAEDIQGATGITPETAKLDAKTQTEMAQQQAAPLFDAALQGNAVWNPKLAEAAQDPLVKNALSQAYKLNGGEAKATVPNPEYVTPSATGQMNVGPEAYQRWVKSGSNDPADLIAAANEGVPRTVPTDKTWDLARKVLSYGVDRDPITGAPSYSPQNKAMSDRAANLSPLLREAIPGYSTALDASGEYLSNRKAGELGAKQFDAGKGSLGSAEFGQRFQGLSPGEQQATRQGYLGQLYSKIEKGGFNPDTITSSKLHQDVLRTMFGHDAAQGILGALAREKAFAQGGSQIGKVKGKPQPAHVDPMTGALIGGVSGGLHGAAHGALEAATMGGTKKLVHDLKNGAVRPAVASALSELMAMSPQEAASLMRAEHVARQNRPLSKSPMKSALSEVGKGAKRALAVGGGHAVAGALSGF